MGRVRASHPLRAALAASAGLAWLAACGTSGAHAGGQQPAQHARSAAAVLASAISAVRASGAVHVDLRITSGSSSAEYSDDAGADAGTEVITASNGASVTVLEVSKVGYVKANPSGLTGFLGISAGEAQRMSGRWISFSPGSLSYQHVIARVTIASIAEELSLAAPLRYAGTSKVAGRAVVGLQGGVPGAMDTSMGGSGRLEVAASGRPLPVRFSVVAGGGAEQAAFSRWGEPVRVIAPLNPVPSSEIMS
jgi:hypothetical protein